MPQTTRRNATHSPNLGPRPILRLPLIVHLTAATGIAGMCACAPQAPSGARDRAKVVSSAVNASSTNAPRDSANVYMVGPSVLNHAMPAMLDQIAQSFGKNHQYDLQVKNGTALQGQWNTPPLGEGRMGRASNGPDAIANGGFDTVVLTDLPGIDVDTQWNCTYAYALEFYNLAVEANPNVQVYIYETWVETYRPSWTDLVIQLRDIYQHYVFDLVHQPPNGARVIRDPTQPGACPHPNPPAFREPGRNMRIIPVGRATVALAQAIDQGTVPGISSIDDIIPDGLHGNDIGDYFVALVFYATLYGSNPAGAPTQLVDEWSTPFQAPDPALAARLQQIAWDTVRTDPMSGVQ